MREEGKEIDSHNVLEAFSLSCCSCPAVNQDRNCAVHSINHIGALQLQMCTVPTLIFSCLNLELPMESHS